MKSITGMFIGLGIFTLANVAHAALPVSLQTQIISTGSMDSPVQIAAQSQGLQLMDPTALPPYATYWVALAGGLTAPLPMCPGTNYPTYAITDNIFLVDQSGNALTVRCPPGTPPTSAMVSAAADMQGNAVLNLIAQVQTVAAAQQMRSLARAMGMDDSGPPTPSGGAGGGGDTTFSSSFVLDTNGLYLDITSVLNGLANLNLHNATNQVYALWCATNLATPMTGWQVQSEIWPAPGTADTNCINFNVPAFDGTSVFWRAQDWTGVDSDGDGIPDWWMWKFYGEYGRLNLNATNLDSQGNSLGYDYTNGLDPNVIAFTIIATNDYLNTASANVQLNITAGWPYYYAVLVNGSASTNWQSFVSTNLTVSLGSTDGVYNVTIGLKGFPTDATQTWQGITFQRDASPLVLMLTNLPSLGGSRPFIDPAGYASRALLNVSYTVIDANGGTNSGQGQAVSQGLNLDDPFHVTNLISCVDLALALGTNYISISATDWAGNVAVTNFSYVFDTNGDVTPPAMTLLWPQDGALVSGDSFTVQAAIDDDTASVVLQYTDTNATVQQINGLVERGGNLWVENVPLFPGTNSISLWAMDAAGNQSSTNISVVKSDSSLTIETPSDSDLQSGTVTVYGTVDDTSAAISVNGVAGVNNGDGTWEVDNVPLTAGGPVMLVAKTAAGGSTNETGLEKDRQPVVFTQTYSYALDYDWHWGFDDEHVHLALQWARGLGGTNLHTSISTDTNSGIVYSNNTTTIWPADSGYKPTLAGQTVTSYFTNGVLASSSTTNAVAPSVEWMEQSASSGSWPGYFNVNWTEKSGREVRLFTGGKASRQRQGLFDLAANLTVEQWVDSDVPDWELFYDGLSFCPFLWPSYPGVAVPVKEITLGVTGQLGSDGHRWIMQPDNAEINVTPKGPGGSYTGDLPYKQKYKHFIQANNSVYSPWLQPDHVVPTATNFWVGQKITFSPVWWPTTPPYVAANSFFHWHLPGNYVNEAVPYWSGNPIWTSCTNYDVNRDLLANETTYCWYKRDMQAATASVGMNLLFPNGQTVNIAAVGLFDMHKPALIDSNMCEMKDHANLRPSDQCLYLTPDGTDPLIITTNINWTNWVFLGGENGGYSRHWASYTIRNGDLFGFTQIVRSYRAANGLPAIDTGTNYWVDYWDEFAHSKYQGTNNNPTNGVFVLQQADKPSQPLTQTNTQVNDHFKVFFQYLPSGADSIAITLGSVEWSWGFYAQFNTTWTVIPGDLTPGEYHVDDSFPIWNGVTPDQGQ